MLSLTYIASNDCSDCMKCLAARMQNYFYVLVCVSDADNAHLQSRSRAAAVCIPFHTQTGNNWISFFSSSPLLSFSLRWMHAHTLTHTHTCTHACVHTHTHTLSLTHSWGGLWFLCLVSGVLGVMLKKAVRMTINPVAFHYFPFGFTRGPYQTYKKVLSPS